MTIRVVEGALRRLVVAVMAAAAFASLASVVDAARPAGTAPGQLEICKAADNGAAGVSFTFTATNLTTNAVQSVTVVGGTCATPFSADAAKWLIQENLSSGLWTVTGVATQPASALLANKAAQGWAKVLVTSGVETQVTFTNDQASATLKVCKWSHTPELQGAQFSFTVGTQTVTAVAGSSVPTAGCSAALSVQPGSRLNVTEALPAQEKVADIRVGGNLSLTGYKGALAKVTIGPGANMIYFENEPLPPPQQGYVEVCKDAGDTYTTGSFTFTITDRTGFTDTEQVIVDQCTGPILVAAGNVSIAEAPTPNTKVTDISTQPAGMLGPYNLNNGTATVVVPVSTSPADETQVHFVNSAVTAPLKVCKVLTASSAALAGAKFSFSITSANGTSTIQIVASASPSGACKNVTGQVPVGSQVSVTEASMPYVGADGGAPGTGETQVVTVGTGINTISFTNQAYGQFEICKNIAAVAGDPSYAGEVFSFKVNGDATPVQVAAGRCSPPTVLPAGTVTVQEVSLPPGFQFVSSTATGPTGDNRATSGTASNGGNPVTFTVPYFNDATSGGETLVTITNKVQRVQLKICKQLDPGSTTPLGGRDFNFDVYVNGGFNSTVGVQHPYPGPNSCTGLLLNVPVVQGDGSPTTLKVVEASGPGYQTSAITVDNFTGTPTITLGTGTISFSPGVGSVVVTYTNAATPV
jgi:hypothetical protein